jgi:hypothetical protein
MGTGTWMRVIIVGADDTAEGTTEDRLLADALIERGSTVDFAGWDDQGVGWRMFDRVVIRSPWTVYRTGRRGDFLAWARAIADDTVVLPHPDILAWNTHKGYLTALGGIGVNTIPTRVLGSGEPVGDAMGIGTVVAKPAVGCSGHGTRLLEVPGQADVLAAMAACEDVAIQPFRRDIAELGERSVIVIDGCATHAITKFPGNGDFRVQRHFGGRVEPLELSPGVARHAETVVALAVECFGTPIPWVRVDELVDHNGRPELLEFEATDPWLHLERSPEATTRLAATILR